MNNLTSYERFAVDSPGLSEQVITQLESLKNFLSSAPTHWDPQQPIQRYMLPNGDHISCIYWNNLFFMTGTDIVRSLVYRLEAYGRPVKNFKKFEEGIFSDLRNLKPGADAVLEEPRSEFLELLYRNNCIRTQKKQKVFFWFSVPHDRLFIDAIERDFKREATSNPGTINPTTTTNPIDHNEKSELSDQLRSHPLVHTGIPQRMVRFLIGDLASYSAPGANNVPQKTMFNDMEFNPSNSVDSIPPTMSEPFYYFDSSILNTPGLNYSPDPQPGDQNFNYLFPQSDTGLPPMSLFDNMNQTYPPLLSQVDPNPTPRRRSHSAIGLWDNNNPYSRPNHDDHPSIMKSHPCPMTNCGRQFKRSDQLRRHQRTHQHPFQCPAPNCPRTFVRHDQLMQHLALNHSGEPQDESLLLHHHPHDTDQTIFTDPSLDSQPQLYFPVLPSPFHHEVLQSSTHTSHNVPPIPLPTNLYSTNYSDLPTVNKGTKFSLPTSIHHHPTNNPITTGLSVMEPESIFLSGSTTDHSIANTVPH